jgi:hypothetical protein
VRPQVPMSLRLRRALGSCSSPVRAARATVAALAVLGAFTLAFPAMAGDPDHRLQAALRYVRAKCGNTAEPIRAMWVHGWAFNAIYGNCMAADGRDQHIWFFLRGRFIGTDARDASKEIIGIWRDDRTIAFMYVLYRSSDANCCPTAGGRIVRFRWTGRRVVALDRLPPPVGRAGARVGR